MKAILRCAFVLALRSGFVTAQVCSGSVPTISEGVWLKNENTCGLHPEITSLCGGTIPLLPGGTAVYELPIGKDHGDIDFQLVATGSSLTPRMALEGPGGCDSLSGCLFTATPSSGIKTLPLAAPPGTYHLFVTADRSSHDNCGQFALVVEGNFGVRDQTITFRSVAPTSAQAGSRYDAFARASSGLPLEWSIDASSTSDCAISRSAAEVAEIDFSKTGTCTVNANQSGNSGYSPAPQAQQTFTVHSAIPSVLAVTPDPPADGFVGIPLTTSLQVTEYDRFGNVADSDNVSTIALSANGPGHLRDEPVISTVIDGEAKFSGNLILDSVGDYTLTAASSAPGVSTITSRTFSVNSPPGVLLQFTPSPPSLIEADSSVGAVVVTEQDQFGNRVASDNSTVVTLSADVCGGTVLGMQSLTAGQAIFDTVQAFHTVQHVNLIASASPLLVPMAASASFDVASNIDAIFFDGYEVCVP